MGNSGLVSVIVFAGCLSIGWAVGNVLKSDGDDIEVQIEQAIKKCEQNIPRNQNCKVVISAVVDGHQGPVEDKQKPERLKRLDNYLSNELTIDEMKHLSENEFLCKNYILDRLLHCLRSAEPLKIEEKE